MKPNHIRNSIAYLFLAFFISIKLLGLHSLTHENDNEHDEHCVICEHAIIHNLTPVLTATVQVFLIQNVEFIIKTEILKKYNFIISSSIYLDKLLSRPPPFFT